MKRLGKLKDFQWKTVEEVLLRLENRPVYSLADEVGLGKTLVLTEVMLQTYLRKIRTPKRYFVFYVAPSHELISQNLHGISKYLSDRIATELDGRKTDVKILAYNSRLTRLNLDSASKESRVEGASESTKFIHLVGLSPHTSFKVNGRGELSERCFMAHLFGHRKHEDNREFIYDWFWALKRKRDPGDFKKRYMYKFGNALGERVGEISSLLRADPLLISFLDEAFAHDMSYWGRHPKEHGRLLGKIRKQVIETTVFGKSSDIRCDFLVLDEWHKYSDLCLSEKEKLNQLITNTRSSATAKTLLVSATPFKVDFSHRDKVRTKSKQNVGTNYFEDLFKLVYGIEYQIPYKQFNDSRTQFLMSVSDFISSYSVDKKSEYEQVFQRAIMDREDYLEKLKEITIRTERPKQSSFDLETISSFNNEVDWIGNRLSLREYLSNFQKYKSSKTNEPTRSPISRMYLDGSSFTEFNDYNIRGPKLGVGNWKTKTLGNYIEKKIGVWPFSRILPPLWLNPQLGFDKVLIFTEYRFTPPEICEHLTRDNPYVDETKRSGTVFGHFPVVDRRVKEFHAKNTFHWIYFYPPLFAENKDHKVISRKSFEAIISDSKSIKQALFRLERNLIGGSKETLERLDLRYRYLSDDDYNPSRREAKDLLWGIFGQKLKTTLGKSMAKLLGSEFSKIVPDSNIEKNILLISYWFLRTFVSDNSQRIYERIRESRKSDSLFDPATIHLEYVGWYCKKFDFEGTFSKYLSLLTKGYGTPEEVLKEFYLSMALKGNRTYGRHFRPFLDSKESDAKLDDGEGYSQRTIRNAFNSPFPPYVLVSTSIGQEGLDFHRYCKTIVHWSPPYSPSVMQQREGRIDRYMSQQVRDAIEEYGVDDSVEKLEGLHPEFTVVSDEGERLNAPNRFVLHLPFSSQLRTWNKCLQRMYYSDLLIGHPDPLAIEKEIRNRIDEVDEVKLKDLYDKLKELFVDLKPKPQSLKKAS